MIDTIETLPTSTTPIPAKLLAAIEHCATRCGVNICMVDREGRITSRPRLDRTAQPAYFPEIDDVVKGALETRHGDVTLVADVWAGVVPLHRSGAADGFLIAFTSSRSAGAACALTDVLQLVDETVGLHAQAAHQPSGTGAV